MDKEDALKAFDAIESLIVLDNSSDPDEPPEPYPMFAARLDAGVNNYGERTWRVWVTRSSGSFVKYDWQHVLDVARLLGLEVTLENAGAALT